MQEILRKQNLIKFSGVVRYRRIEPKLGRHSNLQICLLISCQISLSGFQEAISIDSNSLLKAVLEVFDQVNM